MKISEQLSQVIVTYYIISESQVLVYKGKTYVAVPFASCSPLKDTPELAEGHRRGLRPHCGSSNCWFMAGLISPAEINWGECRLRCNQGRTDGKRETPSRGDNTLVPVFHLNQFACSRSDPWTWRVSGKWSVNPKKKSSGFATRNNSRVLKGNIFPNKPHDRNVMWLHPDTFDSQRD